MNRHRNLISIFLGVSFVLFWICGCGNKDEVMYTRGEFPIILINEGSEPGGNGTSAHTNKLSSQLQSEIRDFECLTEEPQFVFMITGRSGSTLPRSLFVVENPCLCNYMVEGYSNSDGSFLVEILSGVGQVTILRASIEDQGGIEGRIVKNLVD